MILCLKRDLSIEINGEQCIFKVEVNEVENQNMIEKGDIKYYEEKVKRND
ncbi:MAG: hypothetical protein K1T65_08060 [Candidatus Aramenus sp.]|nr:hypothetical protein [Candidatus Aramenus sp.]